MFLYSALIRFLSRFTNAQFALFLTAGIVLLFSPLLTSGWMADDWIHQALIRQIEPVPAQRNVLSEFFSFMDGDQTRNEMLRNDGYLPWWAPLDLKARFWRPLTALTHLLDHRVAPGSPFAAHVHSFAWGILLVLLALAFFAKIHDGTFSAAQSRGPPASMGDASAPERTSRQQRSEAARDTGIHSSGGENQGHQGIGLENQAQQASPHVPGRTGGPQTNSDLEAEADQRCPQTLRREGMAMVAALAALFYAFDDARFIPIGWVANRNALICGVFGLMTLLLHMKGRLEDWTPGLLLGPLIFGIGLLAGESTLATTAYLFSFALTLDRGRLLNRLLTLVPYALLVVIWRVAYSALGYGAQGSGLYLDPLHTPVRYVLAASQRIPAMIADQFFNFPSLLVSFLPSTVTMPLTLGLLLVLLLFFRPFFLLLKGSRTARFWALGSALSFLPIAATFPGPRLFTFVGLGGACLMAEFIQMALGGSSPPSRGSEDNGQMTPSHASSRQTLPSGARALAIGLIVLHLGLGGLSIPFQSYAFKPLTDVLFGVCELATPTGPGVRDKTVLFVNSNDLCVAYVRYVRAVKQEPAPAMLRLLASGVYDLEIEGVDEHTLEFRIPAGMQSNPADALLRGPDQPLPVGETIRVTGAVFEILDWNARGLVDRFRVRFDEVLRNPSFVWLCTRGTALVPCQPPQPGETVFLKNNLDW